MKPKKGSPEWFRQFSTDELAQMIVNAVSGSRTSRKKKRKPKQKKIISKQESKQSAQK